MSQEFVPYRINNCYPVAIDGTQKMAFSTLRSDELQQRKLKSTQGQSTATPNTRTTSMC